MDFLDSRLDLAKNLSKKFWGKKIVDKFRVLHPDRQTFKFFTSFCFVRVPASTHAGKVHGVREIIPFLTSRALLCYPSASFAFIQGTFPVG